MDPKQPRRYWLTGAGNGIGASLAEALLETGAHLAVSSGRVRSCEALSLRYPGQVLTLPGNLTDSQTVRELGERIARQWGSLDTLIINAGTAEYIDGQTADHTMIEHLLRSNLLAASYCIEAAVPFLRAGSAPHLVGIASPATYLPATATEADGEGMRYLFETARADLAAQDIDVTLVHPGYDIPPPGHGDCFSTPVRWTPDEAARHVLEHLAEHPPELALPVASMTALWPLSSSVETLPADTDARQAKNDDPIKGRR
ncbi:SDR family oxidoreductase [Pseudomonas sp. RGM2987]|uniref:SDR family NAD(P)-dependent oxidoreductase n=1 Tax=Pseudomonas sp. RGM2987 TaxID=2930090 RepID=UPI001FD661AE|nr:SDR family oxidoreductase [Pseudomonas sp. RGM2987]MCJ8207106.1 SDR family oxidoreductase [Pseudomonas sp. RGM2987]